jgi:hypothetical protein
MLLRRFIGPVLSGTPDYNTVAVVVSVAEGNSQARLRLNCMQGVTVLMLNLTACNEKDGHDIIAALTLKTG